MPKPSTPDHALQLLAQQYAGGWFVPDPAVPTGITGETRRPRAAAATQLGPIPRRAGAGLTEAAITFIRPAQRGHTHIPENKLRIVVSKGIIISLVFVQAISAVARPASDC